MRSWYVIANPASGRASGTATAARITQALGADGVKHELVTSRESGDIVELARAACLAGHRHIAIAGGDGSAHHAINGILGAGLADTREVTLAMLPLGTGNDWARTLGIPRRLEPACRLLGAGLPLAHDVGAVSLRHAGQNVTHYFINAAGVGLDAHVVRLVRERFNGRWRYVAGLLLGLRSFTTPELTLQAPGIEHSGATLVVFVGIGRHLGGGMLVAPEACVDDGLFELTIVGKPGTAQLLANLPRLFLGTLARSRWVKVARVASLAISGDTGIEADGEPLGRTPATFRILPRALQVLVPASRWRAPS